MVFVLKIFSEICFNSRMFDLKYINSENYLIFHNKIIHWSLIYWFVSMKKKTQNILDQYTTGRSLSPLGNIHH